MDKLVFDFLEAFHFITYEANKYKSGKSMKGFKTVIQPSAAALTFQSREVIRIPLQQHLKLLW